MIPAWESAGSLKAAAVFSARRDSPTVNLEFGQPSEELARGGAHAQDYNPFGRNGAARETLSCHQTHVVQRERGSESSCYCKVCGMDHGWLVDLISVLKALTCLLGIGGGWLAVAVVA